MNVSLVADATIFDKADFDPGFKRPGYSQAPLRGEDLELSEFIDIGLFETAIQG